MPDELDSLIADAVGDDGGAAPDPVETVPTPSTPQAGDSPQVDAETWDPFLDAGDDAAPPSEPTAQETNADSGATVPDASGTDLSADHPIMVQLREAQAARAHAEALAQQGIAFAQQIEAERE